MKTKSMHYKKRRKLKPSNITTDDINALLPQTQCEECGYKGCKPYAQAIANGEAEINLCAPGGINTLASLGSLLDIETESYKEFVSNNYREPNVAVIDEDMCIGCVKCINVCPVDAIVGTAKMMHTVIEADCTGCDLCVPVCPMDCISISPRTLKNTPDSRKKRYESRLQRLQRLKDEKATLHAKAKLNQKTDARAAKNAAIAEAIARAKAKKS